MILVIDIGNTHIVFGIFKGKKLLKTLRVETYISRKPSYYEKAIKKFIKNKPNSQEVDGVIISSVAPKALKIIKKSLKRTFRTKVLILGENAKVPIVNKYKRPSQVGQDRLVNAFAVLKIYKKVPALVVDFGTAVTIDAISKKGAYLGGVIVPGVELSIENLARRAALLPRIGLRKPKNVLGRSTIESMLSGIFYGYASLCDGIVERLKKRLKSRPIVIATGGHAKILSSFCKKIDRIDPQLTLKGLNSIYDAIPKNSRN